MIYFSAGYEDTIDVSSEAPSRSLHQSTLQGQGDTSQKLLIDSTSCRGCTELVQHFAYRGSSHRRKGAARHVIDMVWLYRSPIPSGE